MEVVEMEKGSCPDSMKDELKYHRGEDTDRDNHQGEDADRDNHHEEDADRNNHHGEDADRDTRKSTVM
jgi:hypothetical protein